MKRKLPLIICLLLGYLQINAQAIFNPDIHTAVGFGDVNSPGAEGPQQIIDQDATTKFLDFNILDGMGFDVDLLGVASAASSIRIVTANDAPERDPTDFEILGSNDGANYISVAKGEIPCVAERFLPRTFGFINSTAYTYYRVDFTGTCATSDIIQVADVQLFTTIGDAPSIVCPADIEMGSSPGLCGAIVDYAVTASDTEDGTLVPEVVSGAVSGSTFPIGTSAVVFSVTDSDNNVISCNFNITINDTENPTIDCPGDLVVGLADPNDNSAVVEYDLNIADNCSVINPLQEYTPLGSIAGKAYYLSDSTFNALDAFAEASAQGGIVGTIQNEADNIYLLDAILRNNEGMGNVLIGLNDTEIESVFFWPNSQYPEYTNWNENEPNNAGAGGIDEDYTIILTNGFWNDVDSIEERRYLLEIDYQPLQLQGLASGADFPIGVTTNSFVITDAEGNSVNCEFTVTVDPDVSPVDETLAANIAISPNPAYDVLSISNAANLPLENISIYDQQGRLIRSFKLSQSISQQTIDVGDLPAGLYLVQIKGENGVATKKMIKL